MTKEEMIAEVRRRRLIEQVQAKRAQQSAPAELPPAEKPDSGVTMEDVRGLGQRLLKGQTLGFGDEIAGVGRSVIDYAYPSSWGEDAQSFGDKYRMYRDDARATDKRFQENNPGIALVAELAGGIASPTTLVAPGFGATGGVGSRVAQSVVRGGVEGAAYGAGESEGNLLSDVAVGGGAGAVTSGLLTGLGGALGRTLSKRRIQEDLVRPDGSFMPIHLADKEHGLGEFYRNTIGTIPYAKGNLRAQELAHIEKAQTHLDDIAERWRQNKETVGDTYNTMVEGIKASKESALPAAKQAAKTRAAQESQRFMKNTYPETLPSHARSILTEVDIDNPRQVEEAVSNWWTNNGFREVKDNTFNWRGDVDSGLLGSIREKLSQDPDLAIEAFKSIPSLQAMAQKLRLSGPSGKGMSPADYVDEMLRSSEITGINGDALMALRNQFAMASNKGTNGRAPRAIANEIDDFIRAQLKEQDPALVQQFDDQIKTYTTALTLKNVLRKKKVRQNMGQFGPDDWMGSATKYGGKGMSLKQPPLEDAARASYTAVESAKDASGDTARIRATTASALKHARKIKSDATSALENEKRGGALSLAKDELKSLEHARVPQRVSPWSALASTAILGAPISFGVGALPAGVALGTALSSKTAQRVMAGQTETQRALAEAIRKGDLAKYTQLLSRFGAGQATGE